LTSCRCCRSGAREHSQVRALLGQGRHRRRRLLHSRRADAQDGDGTFVIEHVVRGQWSELEREQRIRYWAEQDRRQLRGDYEIGVEQEPGSGGKESAEATIGCWRAIAATLTRLLEARRYVRSLSPRRCRAATCASSPETGTTPSWTSASRFRTASTRIRWTRRRGRSQADQQAGLQPRRDGVGDVYVERERVRLIAFVCRECSRGHLHESTMSKKPTRTRGTAAACADVSSHAGYRHFVRA
jgi:hypothetical protein